MTVHPHTAVEDRGTGYCADCPLPITHPVHKADATAAPLRPVDRDVARVGHLHPPTAHVAAAKALPRTGTLKARIFEVIASRTQGYTDDEIEVLLDHPHQSVSASRNALAADGWIEPLKDEDGRHVTRLTRSGNDAHAWTPTPAALAQRRPTL